MKKLLLLFTICLLTCQAMAQLFEPAKKVYKNPRLSEAIRDHHVVAILPFEAQITYRKIPEKLDSAALENEELELGQSIQFEIYTSLLREFFKFKVRFQNTLETNRLLQAAGITGSLDLYSKEEIAKALGVDAVIFGNYLQKNNSPYSEAAAESPFGYNQNTEITIVMKIANGADGELLWSYSKKMNELSVPDKDLFERQMDKLTKNLPYTKGVFTVF
jgi:hypothetical protein